MEPPRFPPEQIRSEVLGNFRQAKARPPLPALEKAVLSIVAVHLCFLPWAFGGMRVGAQIISAGLGLLGLFTALATTEPGNDNDSRGELRSAPRSAWARLKRFPIFWLGIALFAYGTLQALNPSWHYVRELDRWWMEPVDHLAWLPSGVDSPFSQANPWRAMMILSSAWTVICTLWIGLTRRASVRVLMTAVVLNGVTLAFVALLQRVAGNGKILWFISAPTDYFVATILYKNHAGAFFNLVLSAGAALCLWYSRRPGRATPAPFFAVCTALLALAVILSFSRAALMLLAIFGVVFALPAVMRSLRLKSWAKRGAFLGASAGLLALLLFAGVRFLRIDEAADRMQRLFTKDRFSAIDARATVARATWEMGRDRLLTGWGAGSYRFMFPIYQKRYPQIYMYPWEHDKMYFWEHAHNDYLEFLAEWGLLGSSLLAISVGAWAVYLSRRKVWKNPPVFLLCGGLLLLLVHSWVDFNLQCPAILVTASALAVLSARWVEGERRSSPADG